MANRLMPKALNLTPAPVIGGASGSRRRRTPFGRKWPPIWVTDLQMLRVTEIRPVRESSRVRMMTRAPRRSHFGEQSLPLVILCSATGELCDPLAFEIVRGRGSRAADRRFRFGRCSIDLAHDPR